MIGVLGEDDSDAQMLKCLIRRIVDVNSLCVKTKGCAGKGSLLSKGTRFINLWKATGMEYFVICADADGPDPTPTTSKLLTQVIAPANVQSHACCVVPVQELEAWILADIQAVSKIISSWCPKPISQPELQASPKEYLERLSKAANKRPRYAHAIHNEQVAKHLNLEKLYKACPSFRPFQDFIQKRI